MFLRLFAFCRGFFLFASFGGGKRFFLGAFARGCGGNLFVDVGNQVGELPIVLDELLITGFLSAELFFELGKGTFAACFFPLEFRSVFLLGAFNANQFLLRLVRLCRDDFDVLAAIGKTIDGTVLFSGHVLQDGRHACDVVGIIADQSRLPRVAARVDELRLTDAGDEVFCFRDVQAHDAGLSL